MSEVPLHAQLRRAVTGNSFDETHTDGRENRESEINR